MRTWITAVATAVGVLLASWMVLVLLARRLPPGLRRDVVGFLPDCVTAARRLRRDPRVPRRAKLAVGFAALWVLSPIDLIPEFLPVVGPLDDIVVVVLAVRYAARTIPHDVLLDAWPGNPVLLDRLLGRARTSAGGDGGEDLGAGGSPGRQERRDDPHRGRGGEHRGEPTSTVTA